MTDLGLADSIYRNILHSSEYKECHKNGCVFYWRFAAMRRYSNMLVKYFESNEYSRTISRRSKSRVDVDKIRRMELGRYGVPLVRYFLKTSCKHAENCRFRHDADLSANENNVPDNSNQLSSSNAPSTSVNHRPEANKNVNNATDVDNVTSNTSTVPDVNESSHTRSEHDKLDNAEGVSWHPFRSSFCINVYELLKKSSVEKPISYATAVKSTSNQGTRKLCPHTNKNGFCKYPPGQCGYLHYDVCDICLHAALHPLHEQLRNKHRQECIKKYEKNIELEFGIARSSEKMCCICFEDVMKKPYRERRFGILPNCNHCFCLSCIRQWRQSKMFNNKKACPLCRITSDFVCPSRIWVDTREDKKKAIEKYKAELSNIDCKYFNYGHGRCPFGYICFYRHAYTDGSLYDRGPPPRPRPAIVLDHETMTKILQEFILWAFVVGKENPWQNIAGELEDLVDFFSSPEEPDWLT